MKYAPYIIAGLVAVVLVLSGVSKNREPLQTSGELQASQPASTAPRSWETKTDSQSPVTIKVTPIEFGTSANIWRFDVVFDTHSGSLDDAVVQVAVLVDDKGNTYQPTAWEGPGPGGHHREGTLMFNPIQPTPQYVELKIKNVGGVPERSFRWDVR